MINTLNERLGPLGKALGTANRLLAKQLLAGAVLADSVTQAQVQFLREVLDVREPDRIVWIDNVVNTGRFQPARAAQVRKDLGLDRFSTIVGYVGTRPWERGALQLIETAPRLLHSFPDLGIIILGDGSGIAALKRRAQELGVLDHCVFTGYVPFDQVPSYINSLDVGVSINLRADRSAASELKVRQYLACGRPVVLSPGSNDFVIGQGFGSVVQATDLDGIARALESWLSLSPEAREEFCSRTTRYVRDHLSLEAAIDRRLALWSGKLPAVPAPAFEAGQVD
jgi:glycosyltransferase involved in cell wall biosynthesis